MEHVFRFRATGSGVSFPVGGPYLSRRDKNAISVMYSGWSAMADKKSKTPVYLIDTSSPFYKPLGRRLVICLAAIAWAALEGWHREPFWSVISLACAVYCVYTLFWTYKPPEDAPATASAVENADADPEESADSAPTLENGEKP